MVVNIQVSSLHHKIEPDVLAERPARIETVIWIHGVTIIDTDTAIAALGLEGQLRLLWHNATSSTYIVTVPGDETALDTFIEGLKRILNLPLDILAHELHQAKPGATTPRTAY